MKFMTKVRCHSYIKKVSDGVHIEIFRGDGIPIKIEDVGTADATAIAYKDGKRLRELDDFCGDSVEKVYREKVPCEFEGYVVGATTLKTKGFIGTDYATPLYGHDHAFCFKKTTETVKCAVVYHRSNCKRYVPIDDIEIIEESPFEAHGARHGHWVGVDDEPYEVWECDVCGYIYETDSKLHRYCPNCGADMRGEKE